MKKLMIAAAIVCAAAFAQAAQFAWSAQGLVDEKGAALGNKDYIGFGFYLTGDNTTVGVQTYTIEQAVALAMAPDALDGALADYASTVAGSALDVYFVDEGSGVSSGKAQGFLVLVNQTYTDVDGGADYAPTMYSVIAGEGVIDADVVNILKAGDAKTFQFGAADQGAWQSVPEPTSGLLLLLGVAGLALRRRRA